MTEFRFPQTAPLVLASASKARAQLLRAAGLSFETRPAPLDEDMIRATVEEDLEPEDVAEVLARAKAESVSAGASALVIGADQTLELDGALITKAADMEEARRRLLELSGRTHSLHASVALARGGETIWTDTREARLVMRKLDPAFVGRYLAEAGDAALGSVGCYQIEGLGAQLFEKIDGDLFTIMGLPLLPLLAALRREGALE
jgi:septum formation protein